MTDKETDETVVDYSDAFTSMERAAEERSPGVLDLIETYGQVSAVATGWRPVNAAALGYGIGTTPERMLS